MSVPCPHCGEHITAHVNLSEGYEPNVVNVSIDVGRLAEAIRKHMDTASDYGVAIPSE